MPQQVIPESSVRQVAEDIAQENTVFRSAYRNIDIPERTGSTFEIPVPADTLGEPTRREPGAEFDFGREEYDAVLLDREEYASGSRITEEELADNSFALLEDHVDRHAQKMAERLDEAAFAELSGAAPSANQVGSDNGDDMTFDDVIDGLEALESREGGYEGDTLYVGTGAKNGLVRDLADRGFEVADEQLTQNGIVGNFAGVDIAFYPDGRSGPIRPGREARRGRNRGGEVGGRCQRRAGVRRGRDHRATSRGGCDIRELPAVRRSGASGRRTVRATVRRRRRGYDGVCDRAEGAV